MSDSKDDVSFFEFTVSAGYLGVFGVGCGGVLFVGAFLRRELGGNPLCGKD